MIINFDELKQDPSYSFLDTNEHLKNNIILLTLGGSYAYGTNTPDSDIDIRGCALNTKQEILTNNKLENFVNEETDTVVYGFNKLITLLTNTNPNTVEMLGCKPEHYIYLHPIGKELIDHTHMFLSQKAVYSFGGYAGSQLRRLDNKAVRSASQTEREIHILNSINNAFYTFPSKYFNFPEDSIRLYIDESHQEEYDTEIFMDVNLKHYPLRDYKSMWFEMNNIVKDYSKIGKCNKHVEKHEKLGKHMMHLVRLYYMCFDILEKEKVITYREKEHDELIAIRNGKYLDKNNQPIPEFYEMVDELDNRLKYDKDNTSLPDKPDYKAVNEFMSSVNERVVLGKI